MSRRESRGSAGEASIAVQHTVMHLHEKLIFCSAICRPFLSAGQRYRPLQLYSWLFLL